MRSLLELDLKSTRYVNSFTKRGTWLVKFLTLITNTSDGKIYLLYTLIIPFIFSVNGIAIINFGILAFIFQVPVYLALKNLIKRERPCNSQDDIGGAISPPDRYSFPSGHSASATLFVLIMNIYEPWLTPFLLVWLIVIYLSRVSLGLHYISDVLAGISLGLISFKVGGFMNQYFNLF